MSMFRDGIRIRNTHIASQEIYSPDHFYTCNIIRNGYEYEIHKDIL